MTRWIAAFAMITLVGVGRAQAQTPESAPGHRRAVQDDAPVFFGHETRSGHRIYGGVILNVT